MTWPQTLATEFAITVTNGDVWLAIVLALLLGGACTVFGTWVARTVGLLTSGAPAGETLGVGLGAGLMVVAAWWAAIWSGGRSSFTPVAVGFAIAIGLSIARRLRRQAPSPARSDVVTGDQPASRWSQQTSLLLTAAAGCVFVIAVALVNGSTLAPSPRDGVQPVEFTDEAFYSILGRDLATTGTETNLSPSGFSALPAYPTQVWYHWGELWLASAVIEFFGIAPLAARYFVVLPLVLLAAAALTGTVVRRIARTDSRRAFLFGVIACLFLAPMQVIPISTFSASNVGLIFGITTYGVAAVAVLIALYSLVVLGTRTATWALATFVGCAVAFILPAHIAVGLLAFVGVGSVWAVRVIQSVRATGRLPAVSPVWRRVLVATGVAVAVTLAWSAMTGHGLGGGGQPIVSPFNTSWLGAVAVTILGGGAFYAIAVGWFLMRPRSDVRVDLYFGTAALLVVGALVWGVRLGEFTMFHAFFGGIAVFAAPIAAIAIVSLWDHLRATSHQRLAFWFVAFCAIQLEFGVVSGILRMQAFGAHEYEPIPVSMLEAIRQLPSDAKLAYACGPREEIGVATPQLLSIDAHTGRRVVPMCFAAETLSTFVGAPPTLEVPSLYFQGAPQRELYPNAAANPSSAAIDAFLKSYGIDYIYVDSRHPNSLVVDAVPIASISDSQILRIP